jgi:hypothetical protein
MRRSVPSAKWPLARNTQIREASDTHHLARGKTVDGIAIKSDSVVVLHLTQSALGNHR